MKGVDNVHGLPEESMTTKPEAKHTPTPWELVEKGNAEKCYPAIIRGKYLQIHVSRSENYEDPSIDAAFIVRAVNSHEALLEALERIRRIDSPIYTGNHAHPLSAWQIIAHEAIAKTEHTS